MSNMEKNKTRIKDFVESIVDNRGRNPDKYYDQEAVPVIDNFMIKNTLHPDLTAAERFLNEEQYKTFLRGYIEEDDVLVTLVGGILKEMGIPDHLICLLRNLYAGQEATARTGHGTTDWFQIGKGVYIKAIYCHPVYLTYMQSAA